MPLVSMSKNDPNLGSVNSYVMLLQRFLVINNFLKPNATGADPVNGKFDAEAESAVKSFQGFHGIGVSGVVDGKTWAAIAGVSRTLNVVSPIGFPRYLPLQIIGDTDSVVTVLQGLLFEYSKNIPGQDFIPLGTIVKSDVENSFDEFGSLTEAAVMKFQANRQLHPVDGKVGNDTWEKLLFPKQRLSSPGIPLPVIPRY